MKKGILKIVIFFLLSFSLNNKLFSATNDIVAYLSSSGNSMIYDVFELVSPSSSYNGTFLLACGADNLNWLSTSVVPSNKRFVLPTTAQNGSKLLSNGGGVGFILHVSSDFKTILNLIQFPQGTATTISRIRTTVRTGDPMGELYISGRRYVTDSGLVSGVKKEEYYIARLNHNFINGIPSECIYIQNARAVYNYRNFNMNTQYQPWDVNNKGEVVFGEGATYIFVHDQICLLKKLDAIGNLMVVKGWQMHYTKTGGIKYGYPAPADAAYSVINGNMGFRGSLRSHNSSDFNYTSNDANGNSRTGKYPDDFFYKTFVNPTTGDQEPTDEIVAQPDFSSGLSVGPGRTGRIADHPRSYGWGGVVFDKRNNNLYIGYMCGYSWQKPSDITNKASWDNNHEWEPNVIAFDTDGYVRYWDRCKQESNQDQPDQYMEGVEIDYANEMLLVMVKQHGDGNYTLWRGTSLTANSSAKGFKNMLNGTTGNVHTTWLGKYRLSDFKIYHTTFIAEFISSIGISQAYTEPNYDGWQQQNTGWNTLTTTKRADNGPNVMKVARNGIVSVVLYGPRNFTTTNAYQKMIKPSVLATCGTSSFVRVYSPNLSDVIYSSLICGTHSTSTGFPNNTELYGVYPLKDKVIAVGVHSGSGSEVPVQYSGLNWVKNNYTTGSKTGLFSVLTYPSVTYPEPSDVISYPTIPGYTSQYKIRDKKNGIELYPSVAEEEIQITSASGAQINIYNVAGQLQYNGILEGSILNVSQLKNGIYLVEICLSGIKVTKKLIKK